uniref:Uncharacterized protein n=1 Tax=Micrurus corallinus TaxID=54390 RepID=A0A2D4F8V1_MICCO
MASVMLEQPEAHRDCNLWHPLHIVMRPSSVICKHVCKFRVTNSGQFAPMYLRASSSSCVQPLRNRAFSPPQPLTKFWMPSFVTWSHHEILSCSSRGHPSLNAFSDRLVIDVQEARSRCRNFEQNLLRLVHVASVILVQPFRFNTSIFLQFCANVLNALSPTPRHPRRLSFRRNPPHLLEIFSTTRPSMSLWKSNRSMRCQLLPSKARTFHALETCAQRHRVTTSRKENIRRSNSLGSFLLITASSLFENIFFLDESLVVTGQSLLKFSQESVLIQQPISGRRYSFSCLEVYHLVLNTFYNTWLVLVFLSKLKPALSDPVHFPPHG